MKTDQSEQRASWQCVNNVDVRSPCLGVNKSRRARSMAHNAHTALNWDSSSHAGAATSQGNLQRDRMQSETLRT